jgi:hypothetical protein
MAKGKKGSKGKGKDKDKGVAQITTLDILHARETVLCPRMGDAFALTDKVTKILEDASRQVVEKASSRKYPLINLTSHKLYNFIIPDELFKGLQSLTTINLSKNNLSDSTSLFTVCPSFHVYTINSLF